MRDIIACVDQSGSMAASVVYAGVFSAVLASLPAISTKMVVFDTAVVDLSEKLADPVDVLFGTQLGGGTDINLALTYCQTLVRQPQETILVLISDLCEGGNAGEILKRMGSIVASGVQVIKLLALSDDGAPGLPARRISSRTSWPQPFSDKTSPNGRGQTDSPRNALKRARINQSV